MDILRKFRNFKQTVTIYSVPDNFLWPRNKTVYKRKNLCLQRAQILDRKDRKFMKQVSTLYITLAGEKCYSIT